MDTDIKPVYLIAGSPARRGKPDPLFRAALGESGVARPGVGYLGTASGDDDRFLNFVMKEMQGAGAGRIDHALITPDNADLGKARNVLASADIIFVGGGDVDRGVRVLREKGIADFLLQLYRQGKPFFGVSAGAIMLAREWVRWRDPEDNTTAELFPCLDLAPVICDTHDEEGGWPELQAALRLKEDNVRGYGLVSGTAIKVFHDGRVEALGGVVHQYIRRSGGVDRIADILPVSGT